MAALRRRWSMRNILHQKTALYNSHRTSYVVLLPEVPPDNVETNPVLRTKEIPNFSKISAEHCFNAVTKLACEHDSGVWNTERDLLTPGVKVTFDSLMPPLEKVGATLDAAWGIGKVLYVTNSKVLPPEAYHKIHDRARKARSAKFQSKPIYNACKTLVQGDEKLNETERRLVEKYLLEGRLNGCDLSESSVSHYKVVLNKLEQEKTKFAQRVQVTTKSFNHVVMDPNIVRDFPSDLLRATSLDKSSPSRGPWKVSLEPHIYTPFMQYCPDRTIRWNTWRAARARCSNLQDKEVRNSVALEEIRSLRQDQAKLLGFKSFAQMSMETKMAGSVEAVKKMIEGILTKAFPAQEKEIASLQEFAQSRGFDGKLELWDLPYWRRKQRYSLFNYEEGELREYFPLPRVINGLFSLIDELFNVKMVEEDHSLCWHPDVKLYSLRDEAGNVLAHLYLDLYMRPGEKFMSREASSWMIGIRSRSDVVGHTPSAAVVLNLSSPIHGIPALLSLDDVSLLFSKVGHALQNLLTEAPYTDIAGLTNTEWDAVQVSSNFLQHWVYDWTTMQRISGHFEGGQPLPKEMFDQVSRASSHMAATDLCQTLYSSALDIELYDTKDFWLDIIRRLWPKFYPFPLDRSDAHPCSFTEIVSGDWPAAYYANFWSKLIAADVFSAFQEAGLEDRAAIKTIGQRFRKTILANGGSCHASESFRRFRGRDPVPDALLANLGLRKPIQRVIH